MKRSLLGQVLLLVLFHATGLAQAPVPADVRARLDSLRTARDTLRLELLDRLVGDYYQIDPNKALQYARQGVAESRSLQNQPQEGQFLNNIAICHSILGELDSSKFYFLKAGDVGKAHQNLDLVYSAAQNVAVIEYQRGRHDSALFYFKPVFDKISKEKNARKRADAYSFMGAILIQQKDYDGAHFYLAKAYDLYKEEGRDKFAIAKALNNLAIIARNRNDYPTALKYYEEAIGLIKADGPSTSLGDLLNNAGAAHFDLKQWSRARERLEAALDIWKKLDNPQGLANTYIKLGGLYLQFNERERAVACYEQGLSAARLVRNFGLTQQALQGLEQYYVGANRKDRAYDYIKEEKRLADSLSEIQNKTLQAEMRARFDLEHKNQQLALHQATAKTQALQRNLLVSLAALLAMLAGFIFYRYRAKRRTSALLGRQNDEIRRANAELTQQKQVIQEKNTKIEDSIHYARRIQLAILPMEAAITFHFPESFVFYRARDIVSGDFYWATALDNAFYLAIVDCTGHGVPGAFMSVMGYTLLNQLVQEQHVEDPAAILTLLDMRIQDALHQENADGALDGMDVGICRYERRELTFAGAKLSLYLWQDDALTLFKGDRCSAGGASAIEKRFTTQDIPARPGARCYLFSDGVVDQFGGQTRRKFGLQRLEEFLRTHQHLSMPAQLTAFTAVFDGWQGAHAQLDDLTFIGFELPA